MAAGKGDHFIHCGTLTISEREWGAFVNALRSCLGQAIEVDEPIGHTA
jgi:hypothetical protein